MAVRAVALVVHTHVIGITGGIVSIIYPKRYKVIAAPVRLIVRTALLAGVSTLIPIVVPTSDT